MGLNVVVAPSGLKGSLNAADVASAIAAGVRRAVPTAEIVTAPVPDGGEGFARGLVGAVGGTLHEVEVTGPLGDPVGARFAMLDGHDRPTAALAMSSAAGLHLMPDGGGRRSLEASTYGVGTLIRAALDAGAQRVLVGCGDSGTTDGGAGMAQALGARLLDANGRELGPGGGALVEIDRIDLSSMDPRPSHVDIEVAVNPTVYLTGASGVARVFGPQKGADPDDVERLETGLARWGDVLSGHCGRDVRLEPGSGASGGLAAGLTALLGARLVPRFELISRYLDLDALIERADLVITAEGSVDAQSARGKVPADVARRAAALAVPVIVLAGRIGDGARSMLDIGVNAWASILAEPCTLHDAMDEAGPALEAVAEQTLRTVMVGWAMARSDSGSE